MNIQKLKLLYRSGGFTASLKGNAIRKKSGYCVGITNNKSRNIYKLFGTLYKVKLFINGYRIYIGGWRDKGFYYLDYTIIEQDKHKALQLGKMFNQIAIYDLNKGVSINVK